jgi:hypothetical protein
MAAIAAPIAIPCRHRTSGKIFTATAKSAENAKGDVRISLGVLGVLGGKCF